MHPLTFPGIRGSLIKVRDQMPERGSEVRVGNQRFVTKSPDISGDEPTVGNETKVQQSGGREWVGGLVYG